MYRHCVFCTSDLGENPVFEAFPVGTRLAFDAARGRLWVVCPSCERWNLTPLEERWETVEACEELFRETPLRVAGEKIGLARHRGGLELVRIGDPVRSEFAAWRYGDQFGRRRRRHLTLGAVGAVAAGGVVVGSAGVMGMAAALQLGTWVFNGHQLVQASTSWLRRDLPIRRREGEPLMVSARQLQTLKVRPGPGSPAPGVPDLLVQLEHRSGPVELEGIDAVRALRGLLPRVNTAGGSGKVVSEATTLLEEAGGPHAFLGRVEDEARRRGMGYMTTPRLPPALRLALEMAAHEETEREAMEGELAWLESTWREAERVAAIADDLALPERVRRHLEDLRARVGRRHASGGDPGSGDDPGSCGKPGPA